MNKLTKSNVALPEKKTLTCKEVCQYLGLGRNTARKIGLEAGAVRRIGRRVLYDRVTLDNYVDQMK